MSARYDVFGCPWCDTAPILEPWHGGGPKKCMVSCDNDYCEVRPHVTGATAFLAVEAWNNRASAPTIHHDITKTKP